MFRPDEVKGVRNRATGVEDEKGLQSNAIKEKLFSPFICYLYLSESPLAEGNNEKIVLLLQDGTRQCE